MIKKILILSLGLIVALIGGGFCYLQLKQPNSLPPQDIQVPSTPEAIARGEYIFTVLADCDGCHSQRDATKFGLPVIVSGRGRGFTFPPELGLPGNVTAPNITSDMETGIGAWTNGEKIRAIREGISRDGRALFAFMPYQAFAKMSDKDVLSLVAYINTLPPVKNATPRTELKFPVNLLIKFDPAPARNVPEMADKGEYLVTIAECQTCHTILKDGVPTPGMEFAGGEPFSMLGFKVVSANITPDNDTGIGKLSEAEFVEKFRQYRKYDVEGAPPLTADNFTLMPWLPFSRLSDEELKAIYGYLRKVKPVSHAVETRPGAAK
ncbi:MAG: cytochrome c [Acidobacteria bacterium]|nr:cytochrome c [Acidobacteriota bacterium]